MLAIVVVACAVVSAPAFAASEPIGLTAVARSDHLVELTWSWPASPTYPDELDVYRDGNVFVASVADASSTSFADTIDSLSAPGNPYHYYLVTVTGGITGTPTATTPDVTMRDDLPNKPTSVAASFGPGTNNLAHRHVAARGHGRRRHLHGDGPAGGRRPDHHAAPSSTPTTARTAR